MSERRHDIDRLRVFATLVIFVFHSVSLFSTTGWHVKNPDQYVGATIFIGMIDAWIMPLFFLLSGVGSWYALNRRGNRAYLKERFLRLAVPYLLAGGLILLPPQFWLESMTNQGFQGGFIDSLPLYLKIVHLNWLVPFIHPWSGHLWFLAYLATISVITLPLMRFLKSKTGAPVLAKITAMVTGRFGPLLWIIPVFLLQLGLRGLFPDQFGTASLVYFSVFFVWGYLLPACGAGFMRRCRSLTLPCLGLALAMFGAEGYMVLDQGYSYPSGQNFSPFLPYALFQLVMSVQTCCWLVAILGMGDRWLNRPSKHLASANEAVLPFYLLHQTVILLVGYLVVRLDWACLPKLGLVMAVSFTVIILVYALLIRPFKPCRFLFGMRL